MQRRSFLKTTLSLPAIHAFGGRGNSGRLRASEPQFISTAATGLLRTERDQSNASMGHEQAFLTDLQKRCYQYFLDAADPSTGLIADRGSRDGTGFSRHASSAACGFALAAHAIAPTAKLATSNQARDRIRQLLRSLVDLSEHHRGFVYHFVDQRTGRRALQCEASSVDTALMLAGVMCAQTTFADDHDINAMSDELIRRTDWQAMLGDDDTLHMGWRPEEGLLPHRWDRFSELTILVLMAIGAPTNAIGKHCWHAWRRDHTLTHQGESFLSYPPLFVHQYPMAFFDFRNVRSPSGRDYFRNSVVAHHAQIEFLTQLGRRYPSMQHYGNDLWGITSSDSVTGYRDWGGPYEDDRFEPDRGIDGTLVPSAAAGGLAIVPTQALHTLRVQHERFGDAIYGRYGFANAFNPANGWVSPDCIGIDTGITLLMAENRLRGGVWNAFMRHAIARAAFDRVGFRLVAS